MVWPATTRPCIPSRMARAATTSRKRDSVVVGLVAVQVDRPAGLLGQVEDEVDLLDPVVARPLVVRDAADHVAAEAHRLAHQLLAVGEGEDPVLREGDQPQVDQVAHLVAQLEQGAQRHEVRIADVDVGPDQAGPLGHLPQDRLASAPLHILDGERGLALGPGQDPLDQRPGLVVARLADSEHRIEVDVRIDQRWREQRPLGIKHRRRTGIQLPAWADGGDAAVADSDIDRFGSEPAGWMDPCVADDQVQSHRPAFR